MIYSGICIRRILLKCATICPTLRPGIIFPDSRLHRGNLYELFMQSVFADIALSRDIKAVGFPCRFVRYGRNLLHSTYATDARQVRKIAPESKTYPSMFNTAEQENGAICYWVIHFNGAGNP